MDWTGGVSGDLSIYPGEGERLVGAISFKGVIIAFKFPRGIYLIDTRPVAVADWKVRRINRRIGASSPLAIIEADDDVVFMDANGSLHLVSQITDDRFGNRNLSQVGGADMDNFVRKNVNLGGLSDARAIYYVDAREIHVAMPLIGSSVNNVRLVLDLNRLDLVRFRSSSRDTIRSMWLQQDSDSILRPTIGDSVGFVFNLDQEALNKDGAGYTSTFQSPHIDFSDLDPTFGTRRKEGRFLELVVEPVGNWDLSVDILWDGEITETVQFNMGQTGGALGSFVFGTDVLAGDQVLNKKRRITGGGRRFGIQGRQSGVDQGFSIARFFLHFQLSDERLD